jgi:hypothetical protein
LPARNDRLFNVSTPGRVEKPATFGISAYGFEAIRDPELGQIDWCAIR